jgi:hypothetical protein
MLRTLCTVHSSDLTIGSGELVATSLRLLPPPSLLLPLLLLLQVMALPAGVQPMASQLSEWMVAMHVPCTVPPKRPAGLHWPTTALC